jgi:ATP-dependent DNA ligase
MKDLEQIAPQVARGKFTETLWTDDNYVAEEKFDGERYKMHMFKNGNRFDSRVVSKKTGLFTEKTDNVPHLRDYIIQELDGTVLDGEAQLGNTVMSTSTVMGSLPDVAVAKQKEFGWVNYNVFDVIKLQGEDVRHLSYRTRRVILEQLYVIHLENNPYIVLTPAVRENKEKYCEEIWARGGEGVILKNINAPYTDKNAWVKVKTQSTYDVVIMGYKDPKEVSIKVGDTEETTTKFALLGWIGAIEFGQFIDGKLKTFGFTSGMPDNIRQMISEKRHDYIGHVITIEAQSRIPKSGYFRHPRFLRLRDDKLPTDCVYDVNER